MFMLSKPTGNESIPPALLAYVAQKLKNDFYHVVMNAFKESGLSQSDLVTKSGIDKSQLHRQLSGPSNWTIETVAKLLFSINGHLVQPTTFDVDVQAPANMTQPTWLAESKHVKTAPGTSMTTFHLTSGSGKSYTSSQPKFINLTVLEEENA